VQTLQSGLPRHIVNDEPLARFVQESSKFNLNGAKPSAFVPPKNGLMSVARHGSEPKDELQALATEYLPAKRVYGAAILTASAVRSAGLEAEADEPPRRHANIMNWPSDSDADVQKAQRLSRAQTLARNSEWVQF
jgi:hypothetical protein